MLITITSCIYEYLDVKKILISLECMVLTVVYILSKALICLYILAHLFIHYTVKRVPLSSEISETNRFPRFIETFLNNSFFY